MSLYHRTTGRTAALTAVAAVTVLTGIAGLTVATATLSWWITALLWPVYITAVTFLLIRLGGHGGGQAAFAVVIIAVVTVWLTGTSFYHQVLLDVRGDTTEARVVDRHIETSSRGAESGYYQLLHLDLTPVPGPDMPLGNSPRRLHLREQVTIVEDPRGVVAPRLADTDRRLIDLAGAGACALGALGAVGWTTRRGRQNARAGKTADDQ